MILSASSCSLLPVPHTDTNQRAEPGCLSACLCKGHSYKELEEFGHQPGTVGGGEHLILTTLRVLPSVILSSGDTPAAAAVTFSSFSPQLDVLVPADSRDAASTIHHCFHEEAGLKA
ncbi:hypothetical protein NQZ68_005020 [Dissostichus eleginoides]|nr:hypothetical protein NQZ68_005020 [Dissostichus eleginoides]